MSTKRTLKEKPSAAPAEGTWKAPSHPAEDAVKSAMLASKIIVRTGTINPLPMSAWLKITSQKSGHFVYLPLPIRLIQQIPDEKGGGCLVRGAQGDEATAKENIVEVLTTLNGYPVGGDVSSWSLAG